MSPAFFFFLRIAFAIQGLQVVPNDFKIVFSAFVKNAI